MCPHSKFQGFTAVVRFWSGLWVGLKFMQMREVLNYYVPIQYQVYLYMGFSLAGLVVCCHYVARVEYFFAHENWMPKDKDRSMCHKLKKEWGQTKQDMETHLQYLCYNSIARSANISNYTSCATDEHIMHMTNANLKPVMGYFDVADNASIMMLTKHRNYNFFLKNMYHLCTQDWATQLANNSFYDPPGYMPYHYFHMRYMLSLFSIGSTEGSDIIAYLPSTKGHFWCMTIIIVIGMFVLAFMNAKVTACNTSQTLPLSQIFENFEVIRGVMKQQKVSPLEQDEVLRYLSFVYLDTARTTISHVAQLLNSIPPRIRIGEKQMKFVSNQSFFQVDDLSWRTFTPLALRKYQIVTVAKSDELTDEQSY